MLRCRQPSSSDVSAHGRVLVAADCLAFGGITRKAKAQGMGGGKGNRRHQLENDGRGVNVCRVHSARDQAPVRDIIRDTEESIAMGAKRRRLTQRRDERLERARTQAVGGQPPSGRERRRATARVDERAERVVCAAEDGCCLARPHACEPVLQPERDKCARVERVGAAAARLRDRGETQVSQKPRAEKVPIERRMRRGALGTPKDGVSAAGPLRGTMSHTSVRLRPDGCDGM